MNLDNIDTIIIVMMENRSFDHVLGYLSAPPQNWTNVNGIKEDSMWMARFANEHPNGNRYAPARLTLPDKKLATDPVHERPNIFTQIGGASAVYPVDGYPMNGFVKSCPELHPDTKSPLVMGYYAADDVPTADFFAKNFAICDKWFAPLPAGTQPNRLMAMSGYSDIDINQSVELPEQDIVYEWLEANSIRWRVYHDGLPFLMMMPKALKMFLRGDNFSSVNEFRTDNKKEPADKFPQVVFIEPRYTNAPHVEPATDDHAPTPIANGQDFLMRIYNDLVANPNRWMRSLMIVTYDEHGGFFDHVSPLPTNPTGTKYTPFVSSGVRVPAFIISPFVRERRVFSMPIDHTGILKLLAKKFTPGKPYSDIVDARRISGQPVVDIAEILEASPRAEIPHYDPAIAGYTPGQKAPDPTGDALRLAFERLKQQDPEAANRRFPELVEAFKGKI